MSDTKATPLGGQMDMFREPVMVPDLGEKVERIGRKPVGYYDAREPLTKATGFVDGYDYTANPYSGCTFSCAYCYAANFSVRRDAAMNWGSWVDVKQNFLEAFGRKYEAGSLDGKRVYMSSVTDPYQPVERTLELTRGFLRMLAEHHRPKLVVQTRGALVFRDTDLFREIVEAGGRVQVNVTVTAPPDEAGERVRRIFEPECPSNVVRLRAVRDLSEAGVQTCVTMTPLLYVGDVGGFVEALLGSGAKRFIVQDFHHPREGFAAGTRGKAMALLSELYGCSEDEVLAEYRRSYVVARDALKAALPMLGEGRSGFAPPF